VKLRRELAADRLAARRRRAKTVIQVRERTDMEVAVFSELHHQQRERHRIGATGERDQQTSTGRTQPVPSDGAPDLLVER
jgi:hypothetical protein